MSEQKIIPATCQADSSIAPTPAPKLHGSRFSELPDNDEGSTVSPNLEPKISADIETNQLDKLTANERKQVVATLQREIQELQQQKKTQREARKGKNGRKEDRDEANNEDQDETGELEQEQDWETVNRSGKR